MRPAVQTIDTNDARTAVHFPPLLDLQDWCDDEHIGHASLDAPRWVPTGSHKVIDSTSMPLDTRYVFGETQR